MCTIPMKQEEIISGQENWNEFVDGKDENKIRSEVVCRMKIKNSTGTFIITHGER